MDAVFVDKLDYYSNISGRLDRKLLKQVTAICKTLTVCVWDNFWFMLINTI